MPAAAKRYVKVVKMGRKWSTYLQVDNQRFSVNDFSDKATAEWFGEMLKKAVGRIIKNASHS